MIKTAARILLAAVWLGAAAFAAPAPQDHHANLDLLSIPIADWLDAGEKSEIPWRLQVNKPSLRMDQRMEVVYSGTISAKHLNQSGSLHDLFLVSRISNLDGEWLTASNVVHQYYDRILPKNVEVLFRMRAMVQPGDYLLWLLLYDRSTGKHNTAKRNIHVREIGNDPLPYAFMSLPLAEFPETVEIDDSQFEQVSSELFLPVKNERPLEVHIISTLSPPEQWTDRARLVRRHADYIKGALDTLSQLDLADGEISMTGLDLMRREVVFEQSDVRKLDRIGLNNGFQKAGSPSISAQALQGRKDNGAFFREFLNQQLTEAQPEDPMRVFIVVTSSLLFESGSDLKPLRFEGECHCRIYHLRFRLRLDDVFDQLQTLMKPLHPRAFNVIDANDLRKALAAIIDELNAL